MSVNANVLSQRIRCATLEWLLVHAGDKQEATPKPLLETVPTMWERYLEEFDNTKTRHYASLPGFRSFLTSLRRRKLSSQKMEALKTEVASTREQLGLISEDTTILSFLNSDSEVDHGTSKVRLSLLKSRFEELHRACKSLKKKDHRTTRSLALWKKKANHRREENRNLIRKSQRQNEKIERLSKKSRLNKCHAANCTDEEDTVADNLRSAEKATKALQRQKSKALKEKKKIRHTLAGLRKAVAEVLPFVPPKKALLLRLEVEDPKEDESLVDFKERLTMEAKERHEKEEWAWVRRYAGTDLTQKSMNIILSKWFLPNGRRHTQVSSRTVQRRYASLKRNIIEMGLHLLVEQHQDEDGRSYASVQVADKQKLLTLALKRTGFQPEPGKHAHVRFGGDGRCLSRDNDSVLLTMTPMNLQNRSVIHSQNHMYTLALMEGGEDYCHLKQMLSDFNEFVIKLKQTGITIDGIYTPVKVYLCADLKFLAAVLGLNGFTSTYPCIFCHKTKHELQCNCDSLGGNALIVEYDDGGNPVREECPHWRSASNISRSWWWFYHHLSTNPSFFSNPSHHHGHKRLPAITCFEFEEILPDELHSWLRITDKLLAMLWEEVSSAAIAHGREEECIDRFQSELERASGRYFRVYRGKEGSGKAYTLTTLYGVDRSPLFRQINMEAIFPQQNTPGAVGQEIVTAWQELFNQLWEIYAIYSRPMSTTLELREDLSTIISKWFDLFKELCGLANMTPYLHMLEAHIVTKMGSTIFLNLGEFSCHSLERRNGMQTCMFFRKTMKGGGKHCRAGNNSAKGNALKDLLVRELVLQFCEEVQPKDNAERQHDEEFRRWLLEQEDRDDDDSTDDDSTDDDIDDRTDDDIDDEDQPEDH